MSVVHLWSGLYVGLASRWPYKPRLTAVSEPQQLFQKTGVILELSGEPQPSDVKARAGISKAHRAAVHLIWRLQHKDPGSRLVCLHLVEIFILAFLLNQSCWASWEQIPALRQKSVSLQRERPRKWPRRDMTCSGQCEHNMIYILL